MMSEGAIKVILVQVEQELRFLKTRLPELSDMMIESEEFMERIKGRHPNIYLRLRKYIEIQDKAEALEADWLTVTGTEWNQ